MNKTKIEWCDWTWNPIVGCSKVSAGCQNCYAAAISKRYGFPWGQPVFMPERLVEPLKVKAAARIFVCSMSDFFHEKVLREWKEAVFKVMESASQHTFILLTKRPENVMSWWVELPNVWLGVTAENQAAVNSRLPILRKITAAVRFVSVEPMLEPVIVWPEVDWVIAGPETGPRARRCPGEWIEALAADSKCFFDKRKEGWGRREWPNVPHEHLAKGDTE